MSKKDQAQTSEEEKMGHTAAHVLAAASTVLKPETRLGVGPAIEDGFYHDIDVDENWSEDDLKRLEKEMKKIKARNLVMTHQQVSKKEAREMFADDPFKLELIDEIEDEMVGISDMGDGFFVTLCEGGHVESTSKIGFFKLIRLAGVYWKGDTGNAQLQRIYGVTFETEPELKEYLQLREEAKKRDHRKLGQKLDLFTFSPLVGPGLPLFTPRGTVIRQQLENFLWELQERHGFERVTIPHIAKRDLYEVSGHWDKFQNDIFHVKGKSEAEFVMKPMNCPHHTQIYAARKRSYKELPIRYSEVTMMYRDEQVGELQGLSRVRAISVDDAHIFCTADQVSQEIDMVYGIITKFYQVFDMKLLVHLSLRDPKEPEKYLGGEEVWRKAEGKLRDILRNQKVEFEEDKGEAAFYGPKIDFAAEDSLKRKWQLATIQLDFNLPERFDLTYTADDGEQKRVVMIHRAITGSLERFMAILLEHYAGALPLWLSPTQVKVLPIADDQLGYARGAVEKLRAVGIRAEMDERSESIGKKIREAEMMKVPVMLIVGQKEVEAGQVAVRSREKGDEGGKSLKDVIGELKIKIEKRS